MKNSIIQFAENARVSKQNFPGPSVIHLFRFDNKFRASVTPGVSLILGSCLPAYDHDLDIEQWMERVGGFRTLGYQMSPDLSLSLYWDTAAWNRPGVGARRHRQYFVQIERPGRETWLWCSEPIARQMFAEAFGMAPGSSSTSQMSSIADPLTSRCDWWTNPGIEPGETAPIMPQGWSFRAITTPCLN